VDETIVRIGAALQQARGFSANIAHDLKTPLTRLRIRLETALWRKVTARTRLARRWSSVTRPSPSSMRSCGFPNWRAGRWNRRSPPSI
jgi:signal transduction histidine kinase